MIKLQMLFSKLKRIIVITFIVTMLSNYIAILAEIGNIAFATENEFQAEYTSNVKNINSEEINTVNDSSQGNIVEENATDNNSTLDNNTGDNEITEEDIEKLNQITPHTELNVNNYMKIDNEFVKGVIVDATLKFVLDTKELELNGVDANFELPKLGNSIPYKYKIIENSENIIVNQDDVNNINLKIEKNYNNSLEEIRIVFLYGQEAIQESEIKAFGEIKITSSGYESVKTFENSANLENESETLVNYSISSDTPSKYKGYLYANTILKNKEEISYSTTNIVNIENKENFDEIILDNNTDKYVAEDQSEMDLASFLKYKSSSISVQEFQNVLGEDGIIEIYNVAGEKLGEINKDSEIKNDNYYFYYNTPIDRIILKIKNIKSNGTIHIKNNKVIVGTDNFTKDIIQTFKSIKSVTINETVELFNEDEVVIQSVNTENNINLEETESKAELSLSSDSFSSNTENNVTLNVSLRTDSEQYELYKNPKIEIVFPEQFENVKINNVNLLYKNGLSLSEWKIEKNEQNQNVLIIKLDGAQEEYLPGIIQGTNIKVDLTVTLDELTTSNSGVIKFKFNNESGTQTSYEKEGKEYDEHEIIFVSKAELFKTANLKNIADNKEIISSKNTTSNIGILEANDGEKILQSSFKYINNLKEDMNNVEIIGRLPFVGNLDGNNNKLGTTIETLLKNAIKTSGLIAKVYYSEDGTAMSADDSWKETVDNYNNIKSFKIVIENGTMHQGESIEVTYDTLVNANLGYNQLISSSATIYYNLNGEQRTDDIIIGAKTEENNDINLDDYTVLENNDQEKLSDKSVSEKNEEKQILDDLVIATKVTAGDTVINADDKVNEKQILKYETILQNNSNKAIHNIELKGNANNSNMYYFYTYEIISSTTGGPATTGEWKEDTDGSYKYATMNIPELKPGENTKFEYYVITNKLNELQNDDKQVYGKITIKSDEIDEFSVETIKNTIKEAKLELSVTRAGLEDVNNMYVASTDYYSLQATVKNISNEELKNVVVNYVLSDGITYSPVTEVLQEDYRLSVKPTANGTVVSVVIDELPANEEKKLYIATYADDLDLSVVEKDISVSVNSTLDDNYYVSNNYVRTVKQQKTKYETQLTSNKKDGESIKDGDKIIYNYQVKNIGSVDGWTEITDIFPDGLDVESVKLYREDGTILDLASSLVNTNEESVDTTDTDEQDGEYIYVGDEDNYSYIEDELTDEDLKNFQYVDETIDDSSENDVETVNLDENDETENTTLKGNLDYLAEIKSGETIKVEIVGKFNLENCNQEETFVNEINIGENEQTIKTSEDEQVLDNEEIDENKISLNITYPENYINEDNILVYTDENNVDTVINDTDGNTQDANVESGDIDEIDDITDLNEDVIEDNNTDLSNVLQYSEKILESDKTDTIPSLNIISAKSIKYEKKATISGNIWIDKNNNKTNDTDDEFLKNQTVELYDVSNNVLVDSVKTNDNGKYKFSNISEGKYVVIFSYDETKYELINSNIESNNIVTNSQNSYSMSNIIDVNKNDITIDMGLVEKHKFDLNINGYITSIKVKDSKDTQNYEFEDGDDVKLKISSSKLKNAEITANFKIKITNNGDISAYVNQIKNIIPEGWEFLEEQNPNWTKGEENTIYSSSIENTEISAGGSEEINLVLTKKVGKNNSGIFENKVSINQYSNELELLDDNNDNNEASIKFEISAKKSIVSYFIYTIITIAIFGSILFIINIKLLKNVSNRASINTLAILVFALFIIIMIIIDLLTNNKVEAGVFRSGNDYAADWAYGATTPGYNVTNSSNYRISEYMSNFYGYGTRKQLISKNATYRLSTIAVRTQQCFHGINIKGVTLGSECKILAAIDLGYNNGVTTKFNQMYANYSSKLKKLASKIDVENYITTYDEAQVLAYVGYMCDVQGWGATDDNQKTQNGNSNQTQDTYLNILPYLFYTYPNYNTNIEKISAAKLDKEGLDRSNKGCIKKDDIKNVKSEYNTFNKKNKTQFKLSTDNMDSSKIKITNITGKNTVQKGSKYISGIKIKMPLEGRNSHIKNITKIYINTGSGYKLYTGKIYLYNSSTKKYKGYSQNSTYGLNKVTSNGNYYFDSKYIYLPVSAIGNAKDENVKIQVRNQYYTYEGRLLYFMADYEQNKGVLRGRRRTRSSSVTYKISSEPNIEILKTVHSISGESQKKYAEKGETVTFKITLKNTGNTSIKDVYFTESPQTGLEYVSCQGVTTSDKKSFKYTGTINSGKYVNVYVTYKVTSTNNKDNNKKLTNTVKITKANGKIANTTNFSKSSIFEASASVYMKMYSISINKYIDNITDTNGRNKITYDRENDKSEDIYAEIGDKVTYIIKVNNNGAGNSGVYGDIKINLQDVYNSSALACISNFDGTAEDDIIDKITNDDSGDSSSDNYGDDDYDNIIEEGNPDGIDDGEEETPTDDTEDGATNDDNLDEIDNDSSSDTTPDDSDDIVENKTSDIQKQFTIKQGQSIVIKLTFKINAINPDSLSEYIENLVNIGTRTNRYDNNINLTSDSNTQSSDRFKLRRYRMTILKTVNATTCELGDILTYDIVLKNTGTSPQDGRIYSINVSDIYNSKELKYVSHTASSGWSFGNNVFSNSNGLAPGESAKFTLKMQVIIGSKDEKNIVNKAKISVAKNKNGIDILPILIGNKDSKALTKLLTYHVEVTKYISQHNNSAIYGRDGKSNSQKYDNPVEVEQNDTVRYTLRMKNTGVTNLYSLAITDTLESGIRFSGSDFTRATLYSTDNYENSSNISSNISVSTSNLSRTYNYTNTLKPGETIEIEFEATIDKSNMYLYNLKNEMTISALKNKNNYDLKDPNNNTTSENQEDLINWDVAEIYEYVRLKNLIISGKVWLDSNENGIMENGETNLAGIKVILHDDTNKKVAETYTDTNGNYIFSETNGTGNGADKKMVEGGENSGRVIKATNRNDITGNYDGTSQYINYYIEFYYNGVYYENTIYSGRNNLNGDNSITDLYKVDSNATEYSDLREQLNNNFETIEYNKAIKGTTDNKTNTKSILYSKNGHESSLQLTPETAISAYSFVKSNNMKYNPGIVNQKNIDMLYLSHDGNTEYLKYINLGLKSRKLDLSIKQDVEKLTNTINGSQMTYKFLQGEVSNSPYGGAYVTGGTENPINYVFSYYASDYYYNHKNYTNEEVVQYKENTELNTEITYKITVTNNNVNDTGGVYTIIRELVDYYSSDFISYDPATNTSKIKLMDDDGYLYEATINNVYAWYEQTNGQNQSKGDVIISGTPKYPEHSNVDLKNKYNKIYLTGFDNLKLLQGESFDIYIKFVVARDSNTMQLKLGDKNNIIEINAYSTYYKSTNKPSGYVDMNSNPGNLGLKTDSNNISGKEYADIEDYSQYENDTYKTGITLRVNDPSNSPGTPKERVIQGNIWDDARSETIGTSNDKQYIGNGERNIGVDLKNRNALSNTKKDSRGKLIHDESTDIAAEGIKAQLVEVIKLKDGNGYKIYEELSSNISSWKNAVVDARSNSNGAYELSSFIPGNYKVRFTYGEDVKDVTFNAQEYKSTKYYDIDSFSGNTTTDADNVLSKLEEPKKNDARDDEIRRLEVIKYSETVNNAKTEEAQKTIASQYSEEFMKNTNMNAETAKFVVRTEKVKYDVKELDFNQTNNKIFKIENIDFGIEYRPEVSVSINKYLSEIKLTTNDGKILVDIKYDNEYEKDANGNNTEIITGTTINKKESVGYDQLQYLPTVNDVKGLAYLNVDVDLLQGCTIDITYVFSVNNKSEIDRVSNLLYNLRYKNDAKGYEAYYDEVYTAAGTARNQLYEEYYSNNGKFLKKEKKSNDYYGKYLGNVYYAGTIGSNDVISKLKVDMILDYVDTDLTMVKSKNSGENGNWDTISDEKLLNQGLVRKDNFIEVKESKVENGQNVIRKSTKLVDDNNIVYDIETRHNLAVSVDDKISVNDNANLNKSLSKFLTPYVSDSKTSAGIIYLVTSKVLSGASDTERMTYDNSAEIIQYTSTTGRITSLGTTVGNLNMKNPDYNESDSDFTERVTLAPPTGLEKLKYYASIVKDQLIIISIVICTVLIVGISIRKIKRMKIKVFYK